MDALTLSPRRRLLAYAIIILAVVAGLAGMRLLRPEPQLREAPDARPFVEAVAYRASEEALVIQGYGTVRGEFEATLAAEVSGRVTRLHPQLRSGARLPRGALLVAIDPRPYQARQAELEAEQAAREAELTQLQRQLQRLEELALRQFVATDALDELRARTDMAQAALQRVAASRLGVELDLERTAIHAPFDAVVRSLSVAPGDVLQPGQPLAQLVGVEHLEVDIALRGGEARLLESGPGAQGARIIDPRGSEHSGELARLSGTVDGETRTVTAVLRLRPADAGTAPPRVGEFVRAELLAAGNGRHYRVPRAALREPDAVWYIDGDGHVRRAPVTVLLLSGDHVYVQSGSLGDAGRVLTRHPPILAEGMAVRVREARTGSAP